MSHYHEPYDLDDVCTRIAGGESLRSVAADYLVTDEALRVWLRNDPARSARYEQARIDRAHRFADEVIELSDTVGLSKEEVAKARLQIDTRKWIAAKLYPKTYGDRLMAEHSGEISLASAIKALEQG